MFISFEHLVDESIENVKKATRNNEETLNDVIPMDVEDSDVQKIVESAETLFHYLVEEYEQATRDKLERFITADSYNVNQTVARIFDIPRQKYSCQYCTLVAKNKAGLTNHLRSCKKKQ